jgi:hypothetical protein
VNRAAVSWVSRWWPIRLDHLGPRCPPLLQRCAGAPKQCASMKLTTRHITSCHGMGTQLHTERHSAHHGTLHHSCPRIASFTVPATTIPYYPQRQHGAAAAVPQCSRHTARDSKRIGNKLHSMAAPMDATSAVQRMLLHGRNR